MDIFIGGVKPAKDICVLNVAINSFRSSHNFLYNRTEIEEYGQEKVYMSEVRT